MENEKKKYEIVLASGSPRRRELMNLICSGYTVLASNKEEDMSGHNPTAMVKNLSKMKARDVSSKIISKEACGIVPEAKNYIVIGADTIVVYQDKILGKPATEDIAKEMIRSFAGDTHFVLTGIDIEFIEDGKPIRGINYSVSTKVQVERMTDEEINAYVASGESMDKAGAYAIQGKFAPFISGIEGDYYNIVGFPIASIYQHLKDYIY